VPDAAALGPAEDTTMLRVLAWLFGALAVLIGAAMLALLLINWNALRGPVAELASHALGRKVELGSLEIHPGCTTRIRVADLRIANTDWGKADALLTLEDGEIAISLPPLLTGEREITEVVLYKPVLALEKDTQGRTNWRLGGRKERTRRGSPELPRRTLIETGELSYRDATSGRLLEAGIATARGTAVCGNPLRLVLKGSLEGEPLRVKLTGSSDLRPTPAGEPYAVEADLHLAKSSLDASGTVTNPTAPQSLDLEFQISGPDLAEVLNLVGLAVPATPDYRLSGRLAYEDAVWRLQALEGHLGENEVSASIRLDQQEPAALAAELDIQGPGLAETLGVFGIEAPRTPAYRVSGSLTHQDGEWHLRDFEGQVGQSNLTGTATLTRSQEKPSLKADLSSQQLDLNDLGRGRKRKEKAAEGLFPDTPLPARQLHAMNADISFQGDRLIAGGLAIDQPQFHLRVVDGRAEADSLSFKLAGGSVAGEIALNARESVPSADADLTFENIDLKPVFKDTRFVQEMGGQFLGHLYVLGVGESLDAVMASARGQASVAMRDGSISGLMVEAIGLDVAEALGLALSEDAQVGIRCGRADADIEKGKATLTRFLLDTTDSLLVATGSAKLGEETLELYVEAREKDFSLIDASAPVHVYGNIAAPEVEVGDLEDFPLFEMGEQQDIDCETLLGDAVEHRHSKE
jgi:uncharacterized protein involved in outer membrane biogenesis